MKNVIFTLAALMVAGAAQASTTCSLMVNGAEKSKEVKLINDDSHQKIENGKYVAALILGKQGYMHVTVVSKDGSNVLGVGGMGFDAPNAYIWGSADSANDTVEVSCRY